MRASVRGCWTGRFVWLWTTAGFPQLARSVSEGVAFEVGLDLVSCMDVVHHELHEVGVPIGDRGFASGKCCRFAGPGGLPGGSVAVQSSTAGGDPVPQSVPGFGEVSMPRQR